VLLFRYYHSKMKKEIDLFDLRSQSDQIALLHKAEKTFFLKFIFLLSFFLFSNLFSIGQDFTAAQNKIKSIYINNFIKYVEWKNSVIENEFNVCVQASEGLYTEFAKLSIGRKVNNKSIVVRKVNDGFSCQECDMIFIGRYHDSPKVNDPSCTSFVVVDGLRENDKYNISLLYKDQKLQFKINEALCTKEEYRLASSLKALAL